MTDLTGKTLANRYRVDAFIGRGGMADVYKVWDTRRAVYLAMKVLHADLAQDRAFLRRFTREAQTLEKLQHPNIVRFYGLERDGRVSFITMDYIDGHPLRQEIFDADGPLPAQRVQEIIRPICSALHYAHDSGFVHCDIKPANIMVKNNGDVLVSDFGIARMTEAATMTMVSAGTPAYMSPEQARGLDLTPQSDIYALGILLYEMLTGERPFDGEHARSGGTTGEKVRWEQINLQPPPPRTFNRQLSPELEGILLRALEKTPRIRYASAMDLLDAFEKACGAVPGQVYETAEKTREKQLPKPGSAPKRKRAVAQKPRPRYLVGIGVVVVGIIGLIYLFTVLSQNNAFANIFSNPTSRPTAALMETSTPTVMATHIAEHTPTVIPTATQTLTATETQLPVVTSATTALPTFKSSIQVINYGESISENSTRKIGFYGEAGDIIDIHLWASHARSGSKAPQGVPFVMLTDLSDNTLAEDQGHWPGGISQYTLPYTGGYYILAGTGGYYEITLDLVNKK